MLYENTGSYTPDFAAEIDSEEEIAADEYGVSLETARRILKDRDNAVRRDQGEVFGHILSELIQCSDVELKVRTLGAAYGLGDLNRDCNESDIAKEIGVSRALVSHYVLSWRDLLAGRVPAFDCTIHRKKNKTREIYAKKATNKIYERIKEKYRNHPRL